MSVRQPHTKPLWWELALSAATAAAIASICAFYAFRGFGPQAVETGITLALVLSLGAVICHHVLLTLRVAHLNRINSGLRRAATTDDLTKVLNRAAFARLVTQEARGLRSDNRDSSHTLLMIDVDHFKQINDRMGHATGDQVLYAIASTLRRSLRSTDTIGRLGGEEFGVLLRGTHGESASLAAERLRQCVNTIEVGPPGNKIRLSVSIGGVAFREPLPFDIIYRTADEHLYRAKQRGRNRVELSPGTLPANEGRSRPGLGPNGPILTRLRAVPR
ncbi:GGDEF domain-containing protein [Consotaella aegiceratis]|uniref:GGDEF domain-containing protein n=1 Tax=Consotaella aegiceratis TaxID=3097961 RepID=UPI002F3FB11E